MTMILNFLVDETAFIEFFLSSISLASLKGPRQYTYETYNPPCL